MRTLRDHELSQIFNFTCLYVINYYFPLAQLCFITIINYMVKTLCWKMFYIKKYIEVLNI